MSVVSSKKGGKKDERAAGERGGARVIERASSYVEKKRVFELFESLVQELVIHQPPDPVAFLIATLQKPSVPKIIIAGGPASGKGTQCEKIKERFGVVHISTGDLLRQEIRGETAIGRKAKSYIESGALVPDEVVNLMVQQRLMQADCIERGWLLDGFPRTPKQAEFLLEKGFVASKVILLEVPDEVLVERVSGRRMDPETKKIYHLVFNPPPASIAARLIQRADDTEETVRARIKQFRHNIKGVASFYSGILKGFDGNRDPDLIFSEIEAYIHAPPATRAPRRSARISILGPPGAGKSTQASLVAEQYNCVMISTTDLLHDAYKRDSAIGREARMYSERGEAVPDSILVQMIAERVEAADCRERGWVLDGTPRTREQAEALAAAGINPTAVIVLEADADVIVRRLSGRRIDPVTGKVYHVEANPPPTQEIRKRLVQRATDQEAAILSRIDAYQQSISGIKDFYGDKVHAMDGALEVRNVSELLQGILSNLVRAPGLDFQAQNSAQIVQVDNPSPAKKR
eukprot:comp20628_c0_seq1/m.42071 comp20628_c0_seq1/g.42071  ORF comp20628_c0_seq1/g.42071 comp20628_c0_seq1/m.42071 type:complete len:519 (+) comp20628_c0_seq1:64-1620(+)